MENLRKYSIIEIIAITLASADKTLTVTIIPKQLVQCAAHATKGHNMKPEEVTEELKNKIRANIHKSWF